MPKKNNTGNNPADWFSNLALRTIIGTMLLLPYRARVATMGWIMRKVLAPVFGYNKRSSENLDYVYPDMPIQRRQEIIAGVADNMGRTFIENYSTKKFMARVALNQPKGPGLSAMEEAKITGQPVILVTGHFGNYEAPRAALVARGYNVGGLYRPARNKFFNAHYAQTMLAYGGPIFEQGRRGTTGFVRHLKQGGLLVLLFDQNVVRGENLPFLGKPAATAISAAQLALRYNALLIPFYGIRRENGLDFDIEFEAPLPHSDPISMTRALNSSLEARIQAHPEQWLWIHRRWKVDRSNRKPVRG